MVSSRLVSADASEAERQRELLSAFRRMVEAEARRRSASPLPDRPSTATSSLDRGDPPPGETTWRSARLAAERHAARVRAGEDAEAERLRAEVVPQVRRVLSELRGAGRVGRAWLFGSYAWGFPTGRSDIDVLVEGAADPFEIAGRLIHDVGLMAHVVSFDDAPPSLVERVLSEGVEL